MPENQGAKWTPEEDERLLKEVDRSQAQIAKAHGRSEWAIQCRLKKLTEPLPRIEPNPKSAKFWMLIRLEGPGSEKTTWRHPTELEARTEAAKLASKLLTPIVILEAMGICYPRPADATWEEL